MRTYFTKFKAYFAAHKGMGIAVLIVLAGIGYYGYGKVFAKTAETRYVLGTVSRGTLITSISGTGQVSASNQLDLKPAVSGPVTAVSVVQGQEVKEGQPLIYIQAIDAGQAVRDARVNLQTAQLALQKLQNPSGTNLLQAQDSVAAAQESKTTALNNIQKAYDDGFSAIATAIQDLNDVSSNMTDILYNSRHSPYMSTETIRIYAGQNGLDDKTSAGVKFDSAKNQTDALTAAYRKTNRQADAQTIENIISQAYATTQAVSDALKDVKTTTDYLRQSEQSVPAELTTDQATIASDISKINGDVSALLSIENTLTTSKQAITSSDRTIAEKQSSLSDLTNPAPSDLATAELDVEQKQIALQDAEEKLAEYTIRAPFAGLVAAVDVKVGDTASGSAVATLITKQQIATIALNEIDVAKVKMGEKATLTFDAIPDLTITGQIVSIDTIGTVTQGVVSYNVKIGFDTQDDRIKPGMSVTANIITDSKPDVLLVPTSAIKTINNQTVIQELPGISGTTASSQTGVASPAAPKSIPVQIGSANDSQTEIVSGVNEGDTIVTRTIAASAAAAAAKTPSATSILGGGARGGGGFRGN